MRVLVTGGTGFIGSHTTAAICAAGHQVRLLVRDPAKMRRVYEARGIEIDDFVVGDVTDADAVTKALEGCEALVHTAAVVALEAGRAREVLETNARGVELVVGGACERGFSSIVYVSSLGALFSPGGPPISADSPLATTRSAYARSKADGERTVRALQEAGAPIRCTYPSGVIGPDDPGLSEGNHTIRTFLKDLMLITSSGFQTVDVRDLAAAHAALLDAGVPAGRYVVSGHLLPWADVVALVDEVTGTRVRRVTVPGSVLRVLGVIGDVVKRVYSFDFPLTREVMDFATQWPGAVESPLLRNLGLTFRPSHETYTDTIRWLHREGHVTDEQAGKLAGG
jgi:nucleoside-diphosphate-sugar epimerase